ncbi:phosphatidylcholine:ceramide cholinephosphotransferase 1 [Aplochiton taeniatus]
MKKVSHWSSEEVVRWLGDQGLQEYCDSLRNIDGRSLLKLNQSDFTNPPLSLVTSDGGKQLLERIETLRIENHIQEHKNGHVANGINGHGNGHTTVVINRDGTGTGIVDSESVRGDIHKHTSPQRNGVRNGFTGNGLHHLQQQQQQQQQPSVQSPVQIHVPAPSLTDSPRSSFPGEWRKTGVALVYAAICFVSTTVMISVVHERVPPKEDTPPLPDKFFDLFERREWAFAICEVNGMVLVALWLLQWVLLQYRSIVGRRFFFIVGTLYLYRCITMYITTLPVPGMHFQCSPKLFGDHVSQMRRVMKMIAGGGLTITGSHHMCGDYLYSGHTVMLTLTYLFIKEYSPKRFWWYQWFCWALSVMGLFCILLAHDHYSIDVVVAYYITTRLFWWYHTMANQKHYSIDVVVAYYITTRLFWWYHTMANQKVLKDPSQSNLLSRVWWFRFFLYLEGNVLGTVPRNYQLPWAWRPFQHSQAKYSKLDNTQ